MTEMVTHLLFLPQVHRGDPVLRVSGAAAAAEALRHQRQSREHRRPEREERTPRRLHRRFS